MPAHSLTSAFTADADIMRTAGDTSTYSRQSLGGFDNADMIIASGLHDAALYRPRSQVTVTSQLPSRATHARSR